MAAIACRNGSVTCLSALSPAGRKAWPIDSKVAHGGGVAAISFSDIERQCGMSTATCGLRQVKLLGFVSVETGPRRRINTFRLSTLA